MMIGEPAAIVTAGGGPVDDDLARSASGGARRGSGTCPRVLKVCVYVLPGAMIADTKAPLFETTWWFLVSLFVHLTESPVAIVTVAG